ncbi:MAG: hypothetical protein CLLPBCKN_006909 [Chroococcidiopsis cubana SAG 39.79]|uniref:Uncharacterized protein n=1 Tax=Chroococcidiopsis cubana SAG 39.79 TaxID=388085 RepID=A0AB37U9M7_9CYAN|nr:hypothetical protein [Chroococcidiopsis cubana]MDZ4877474.1 hypothetical protein [Chroococcidiopsis cubana SAG 39.79]PSB51941.1 hypothetical protein C7B79_36100 [Chroococcidiopsis cubana CCALA 043]RUT01179.1 hypothetical protein DSM107010_65900 [Chroococcidiopsis cubana SAG 39.79]
MPFTKENLMMLYSLSLEDVDRTLTAATIPLDKETYEDEEISTRFDIIRNYFNHGQASDYTVAAELFQQHQASEVEAQAQSKNKRSDKGNNSASDNENGTPGGDRLNLLELIANASDRCEIKIELLEAIQIMASCGLEPNQEDFTSDQCDRFVSACDLILKQKKTLEEVVEHFGTPATSPSDSVELQLEQTAMNLEQSGNGIVSEVMKSKAKADATAAASLYLKHLNDEFGSTEFQTAWHQMEEALKVAVAGKSRAKARQMLGEMRAIQPSSLPLNALPKASDNGSTTD